MILAALLMTVAAAAPQPQFATAPANLRLGPQGEILAWLVAGPFPNTGALERKGTGFRADYLATEAEATAYQHKEIPRTPFEAEEDKKQVGLRNGSWSLAVADPKSGLDLKGLLRSDKPGIAYCFTELVSPIDQRVQLLFGSDDGAKVWLNGIQLFEKQVARGIKRDEDKVDLNLKQGKNRLLFKIEQGDGGWGLLARVVDAGGKAAAIHERLALVPADINGSQPWPGYPTFPYRAAGQPGTLDLYEAIQFESWRKKTERWLARFGDPKTSREAIMRLPRVSGWDRNQDELSLELASARKAIERAYHSARKPFLERFQNPGPQFKTSVAKEDYATPMPGGRYFVHANGTPFIPIGYNHNPDWTTFNQANGEEDNYDPTQAEKHIAHVKAKGVNLIRLMIETPPSGNLEEPLGVFRPEHVIWTDTIVAAARKHDVKLIITPWDTFWMNRRWETTSYNPENGGLVKQKIDFITNKEVRKQQKRRLQYMIDRWGNTGTIFSWEILNEGDLWWGANAAQLDEWATDVAGFVREYEKGRWGRNHMVSFSFAAAMPKGDMAKLAYTSKLFDYATTHLYIGANKAPVEPIGPAMAENQGVRYALDQIKDNRPYIDTENGPIDKWIAGQKLDNEVFHAQTWAHLASGGAGSGLRWPYRNPHHLTEGMLDSLKIMREFTLGVDWKTLSGRHVDFKAVAEKGAAVCGFGSSRAALVWTSGSGTLEIAWPAKKARAFNCRTAEWSTVPVVNLPSGRIKIDLPNPSNSTAVVLTR